MKNTLQVLVGSLCTRALAMPDGSIQLLFCGGDGNCALASIQLGGSNGKAKF